MNRQLVIKTAHYAVTALLATPRLVLSTIALLVR